VNFIRKKRKRFIPFYLLNFEPLKTLEEAFIKAFRLKAEGMVIKDLILFMKLGKMDLSQYNF